MGISNKTNLKQQLNEMLTISKAFAHHNRYNMLKLIQSRSAINQTELAFQLKLRQSSVHAHINQLKRAQLVSTQFVKGMGILHYNDDKVKEYKDWLNSF